MSKKKKLFPHQFHDSIPKYNTMCKFCIVSMGEYGWFYYAIMYYLARPEHFSC